MSAKWLYGKIEEWHNSHATHGLHEHLGMSVELYARWLEKPHKFVLGIDEVGYGALAGPLVIGGVLAPTDWDHAELRDSKAWKGKNGKAERGRAKALALLRDAPGDSSFFLHRTEHNVVDELGVYGARLRAWSALVSHVLRSGRDDVLVVLDGDVRIPDLEHVCLPKADGFVPQVMAASIVAKVYRDTEMRGLGKQYPEYDFGENKGYNSTKHKATIQKLGLCPIHRKSYKLKFLAEPSSSPSPQ